MSRPANREIAERLEEAADLLQARGENRFAVEAWRRGAQRIAALEREAAEWIEREGAGGFRSAAGLGPGVAAAVEELVHTGEWGYLERLRRETAPEQVFETVPGIGPELAARIVRTLGVRTLEGLEAAAHDGGLERVPGFGPRRSAMVRAEVEHLLDHGRRRPRGRPARVPPAGLLLDVDREYREKAAAGALRRIAPRRLNPDGKAWLPILETTRGEWRITALFSNPARAHECGTTGDWVVVYAEEPGRGESLHTVVTETRGPLAGRRVVRGREEECRRCYESVEAPAYPLARGDS